MKHMAILLSITMVLLLLNQSIILSKSAESATNELEKLYNATNELDYNVSSWQMTIREKREITNMDGFIHNLKGYELTSAKKEETKKWRGNRQKTTGLDESILIVRTSKKDNIYQITYTISSNNLSQEKLVVANKRVKTVINDLFTKGAKYFSCVEVWKNGTIDIVYFLKKMKSKLNLTLNEEVSEDRLKTWTGSTPEWGNYLVHNKTKINCQIALSKGSTDRTTIKIGTPILITEY